MKIAIVGLGLIGGSIAKGFKKFTNYDILGYDKNESVTKKALRDGSIDGEFTGNFEECDILVLGLFPEAAVNYIRENADKISKNTIIADCGGVKEKVCSGIYPIAKERGFTFIGMHPMAGREQFGYDASIPTLFCGASLILTPYPETPKEKINLLADTFLQLGFSRVQMSSPDEHDKIIAYTSQLAHIVSSGYIKSPQAMCHAGFSAGSFRDLTRVAHLNEHMWTELFLDNPKHLVDEINILINHLIEYRDAIQNSDKDTLFNLLKDGREKKVLSDEINGKE